MADSETPNINGGSRPVPDPTELTDRAIAKEADNREAAVDGIRRAMASAKELLEAQLLIRDERLAGIDKATDLRLMVIDQVPAQIDTKIAQSERTAGERFLKIQTQLSDRDVLFQRESELNATALTAAFNASKEAVAAALTAQKEDAARRDESNQKAIDKSEKATAEKIDKLAELFTTTINGLSQQIGDLKDRVARIESVATGAIAQRTETRQSNAAIYGAIGAVGALIGIIIIVGGLILTAKP